LGTSFFHRYTVLVMMDCRSIRAIPCTNSTSAECFGRRASRTSASCKTATIRKEKCEEVLGRRSGRDLVAQYLLDHIFTYRSDQNLPDKCSDG
jgi:hypothetical protein